jgi:hypothetical protein
MSNPEHWLSSFSAPMQDVVRNWFVFATKNGSRTPAEVVAKVTTVVGHKLAWAVETSSRERCNATLVALRCDVAGALAFAQAVLDAEGQV